MKSMKLFKAIGKIDDKFIIEEEKNIEKEKIQVPIFKRFAMAGLALTIILGISITTYAMVIEKEYNAAVGYLNSLGISVEDLSDYSKSEIIKTVDAYQNYGDSEIVNNLLKNEEIISSPINITSEQVKKLKLEGIVAKEKESIYLPHQRVNFWLKIKNFQKGYFYVHAYIFNELKYSLYLGEYRGNLLYFVGKISVMPDNQIISKIKKTKRSSNLFVNCHDIAEFIKPVNKVLVKYIERTDNLLLREPFLQIPIKLIESRN